MNNKIDASIFDKMYKTHKNMSDDHHNGFRKEGLEFLKERYKFTTQDFIKATYPKKEWANWEVKISRLINKPKDSKENFGALQLAEALAKFVAKKLKPNDLAITPNYFLGRAAYVDIIGASYGNGQIGLFQKKNIKKVSVPARYSGFQAITSRNALSNGMIRLFKPKNYIDPEADNRWGLVQDKKTKIIWVGGIEPRSNGKYDILDKSASTGKTIGILVEDINLAWSTRIEQASFPQYWDY